MKQEIYLLNNSGKEVHSGNEIWPVYVIIQKKNVYKNILQRSGLKTRSFFILKNFCRTESEQVWKLILTLW